MIPQALAETFIQVQDYPRAMEAARRGVEIAPHDPEALSILAWSSYKAGAIQEGVEAASKALDLDPVHSKALWIVLLGHLHLANLEESRSASQHALTVRRVLSPGLDTSFVASFLKELESIKPNNPDISLVVKEIDDALVSEDSERS